MSLPPYHTSIHIEKNQSKGRAIEVIELRALRCQFAMLFHQSCQC